MAFAGVAVWLMAGATHPPSSPGGRSPALSTPGANLAAGITRLHQPRHAVAPPLQVRDLFRYNAKAQRVVRGSDAESAGEHVVPASISATPNLSLAGLAEDEGTDGPVRTAIISGAGELFLVKEGEAVTGQYRVTAVSSDHVELTDIVNGTVLRLGLN